MDDADERRVLALLGDLREQLRSEVADLAGRRESLTAQREALGEELEGVIAQLVAKQRMLSLVEATEQQLAGQGQEEVHERGPAHLSVEAGTEVRGGAI
jgi:predicted  nucleic acid-binding Zn-ribbon protein